MRYDEMTRLEHESASSIAELVRLMEWHTREGRLSLVGMDGHFINLAKQTCEKITGDRFENIGIQLGAAQWDGVMHPGSQWNKVYPIK